MSCAARATDTDVKLADAATALAVFREQCPTASEVHIDGAAFHHGERLRRDSYIRERLAAGTAGWRVVAFGAKDLKDEGRVVGDLGGPRLWAVVAQRDRRRTDGRRRE